MQVNRIINGSALETLKELPDESINCCVTSPPYWALRDYGVTGQLGLEPTFEEYIDKLCTIYDEVKRVLRKDGTCWVNLGDTYWGGGRNRGSDPENMSVKQKSNRGTADFDAAMSFVWSGDYPAKSLCLIPQRFAIEMVNRGWILRNVIIWHKPNPMPSSAKDRFTVDFEYVYFFVKNNQVLWHYRPADGKVSDKQPDFKSGIERLDWEWGIRKGKKVKTSLWQGFKYWFETQYEPYILPMNRWGGIYTDGNVPGSKYLKEDIDPAQLTQRPRSMRPNELGRNKRTVWTIPTQPFPEAHFATYPEKLVEPMIKAGCPEFICTVCGKAREKIYEKSGGTTGKSWHDHNDDIGAGIRQTCGGIPLATAKSRAEKENPYQVNFKGYTDCGCKAEWRPGIVLDMFCRKWNYWISGRSVAA